MTLFSNMNSDFDSIMIHQSLYTDMSKKEEILVSSNVKMSFL